jgi:starvation-inducible DNA-binding protein
MFFVIFIYTFLILYINKKKVVFKLKRLKRLATTEDSKKKLYSVMCSLDTLYKQIKFFHWVMNGDNYIALHRFLDEVADTVSGGVDLIAERLVYIGFNPIFEPKTVMENSNVQYHSSEKYDGFTSIQIIIDGLDIAIKDLADVTEQTGNERDFGTQQFAAELLYDLEVKKHHLESFGN